MRTFVLLLSLFAIAASLDTIPHHARGGRAWRERQGGLTAAPAEAKYFKQVNDHFDASLDTFMQKYFVVDTYFKGDGYPVLLYINGEGPVSGPPSGYLLDVAKELGALVVTMEHRFYGSSIPNNDFSVENLRLLTVEQALADLNYFATFIRSNVEGAANSKFLCVGGSYSGALSSWFREMYPDTVVGAWSSSGVVNAIFDFVQFDEQVAAAAGEECADDIRNITHKIDYMLSTADGNKKVKTLFGARVDVADADFMYMIADSSAMAIQYGHKLDLCSSLKAARESGECIVKNFANYTADLWGAEFGGGCFYDTECLKTDRTMARSWRWQKCSQLAYLQAAPFVKPLRSRIVDLPAQIRQCEEAFAPGVFPDTALFNLRYGGAHPRTTNVVYVDASDDPWQQASVKEAQGKNEPFLYIECDDCGHCIDLDRSGAAVPEPVQKAQSQILEYVKSFLA
uniref:Uncharacterized protein n=2 Tax=Palpitomonas bilix TaxID=652834 RepID=A0A7S3GB52_9EUKA|mmetsp:Transcript_35074/g.90977  ORF Transcript_35074/g.90977 Transcript_35074/m.90977 type:complete len:455 (+) Transcript_35074:83-1447(+)